MSYNELTIISMVNCPCIKDFHPIHLCPGCIYFKGMSVEGERQITKCGFTVQ